MRKKNNSNDLMDLLDEIMPEDAKIRADGKASKIIEFMKLADLRKEKGVKQTEIKNFSQPRISQIENSDDVTSLKIATLIEYAQSIGLGIKVVGFSTEDSDEEFEILRAQ